MAIPDLEIIEVKDSGHLEKYKSSVADIDDIPHIVAYFSGRCEFFVTENRKLTQMKKFLKML